MSRHRHVQAEREHNIQKKNGRMEDEHACLIDMTDKYELWILYR